MKPLPNAETPTIKNARVRPNGAPVITLDDGRVLSYDSNMLAWSTLSSRWWSKGSDVWEGRTRGKASSVGRGILRAIEGIMAHQRKVSCIVDPGSSVISISEDLVKRYHIPYDPEKKIFMQSANGQTDGTLGLVRNLPIEFAGITVYLQLHVVRDAPFEILLGRPFDELTLTSSQTHTDGSQSITITCPNTGAKQTIPTMKRRRHGKRSATSVYFDLAPIQGDQAPIEEDEMDGQEGQSFRE